MDEKQKQAIILLNDLYAQQYIKNDEYFVLLEYVVAQHSQLTTYVPYIPPTTNPTPIEPIYDNHVYCKQKIEKGE